MVAPRLASDIISNVRSMIDVGADTFTDTG